MTAKLGSARYRIQAALRGKVVVDAVVARTGSTLRYAAGRCTVRAAPK